MTSNQQRKDFSPCVFRQETVDITVEWSDVAQTHEPALQRLTFQNQLFTVHTGCVPKQLIFSLTVGEACLKLGNPVNSDLKVLLANCHRKSEVQMTITARSPDPKP